MKNYMNQLISLKNAVPLLAIVFALVLSANAISPPPDGCYPNFTTAEGCNALNLLSSGAGNTGLGWYALFSDTTGSFNTAVGGGALDLNNGDANTAVGVAALLLNSTGSNNTAVGTDALVNNVVDDNTAAGFSALFANTIGGTLETSVLGFTLGPNTAIGSHALESNVDASANTAVGYNALHSQVTGFTFSGDPHLGANTAVGFEALANVTGSPTGQNALNTALGYQALFDLANGDTNVAIGGLAGRGIAFGEDNIAVGYQAGFGLISGDDNIFIGPFQGPATTSENGHTYIANINATDVSGGDTDTVTVDLSTGLLGHLTSSRRYKENIKPMDKASEALYRLKPVTYRYKKEIDRTQSPAFGLIAEEVAEVNPALVAHDAQSQAESVHYEMVNAMLLNEFLKEHRKIEEQQRKVEAQTMKISQLESNLVEQKKNFEARIAQQQKQIGTMEIALQKVTERLESRPPSTRVVTNN
jgi:hypothetical protein